MATARWPPMWSTRRTSGLMPAWAASSAAWVKTLAKVTAWLMASRRAGSSVGRWLLAVVMVVATRFCRGTPVLLGLGVAVPLASGGSGPAVGAAAVPPFLHGVAVEAVPGWGWLAECDES